MAWPVLAGFLLHDALAELFVAAPAPRRAGTGQQHHCQRVLMVSLPVAMLHGGLARRAPRPGQAPGHRDQSPAAAAADVTILQNLDAPAAGDSIKTLRPVTA